MGKSRREDKLSGIVDLGVVLFQGFDEVVVAMGYGGRTVGAGVVTEVLE